jgi:hypothetical protein
MTRLKLSFAVLALVTSFGPAFADSDTPNPILPIEQVLAGTSIVEGRQATPVATSGRIDGAPTRIERAIIEQNLPKIGNGRH